MKNSDFLFLRVIGLISVVCMVFVVVYGINLIISMTSNKWELAAYLSLFIGSLFIVVYKAHR
ncbi:hypothetical protein CD29_19200 [Ureibacillus manganicus DSM 26584]|uniref:Uncharacterized protein n=1 Tax=Ureibacillus manganicus DSM 26584 TaxID=1384049 RepID=A0A0A3HM18_9BACL|nr:hypothetical protein CD29_19200 [Ureibacillus manganicus DSM 26584]